MVLWWWRHFIGRLILDAYTTQVPTVFRALIFDFMIAIAFVESIWKRNLIGWNVRLESNDSSWSEFNGVIRAVRSTVEFIQVYYTAVHSANIHIHYPILKLIKIGYFNTTNRAVLLSCTLFRILQLSYLKKANFRIMLNLEH